MRDLPCTGLAKSNCWGAKGCENMASNELLTREGSATEWEGASICAGISEGVLVNEGCSCGCGRVGAVVDSPPRRRAEAVWLARLVSNSYSSSSSSTDGEGE